MDGLEVDNWDDEFDGLDNLQFRSASTATSVISHAQANHRDSTSSRMSLRSDSNQGDEHWDVPFDEQSSVKDALTIAKSKGIPLPTNLPKSALEGGTIRRLGGKVVKKAIADDWSEDLDFGNGSAQLQLAKAEDRDLSESLRQLSAAFHSSPKSPDDKAFVDSLKSPKSRLAPTPVSLDKFRDQDDEGDFGDVPTIRVAKHRSPRKAQMGTISLDEFENGATDSFDLPSSGQLRLSTKHTSPTTPNPADEIDFELTEGSLGTRHAGLRKGAPSGRSSTISAISPTPSSAFSLPSDDGSDGLILPQGQVNFQDRLKRKQEAEKENQAPQPLSSPTVSQKPPVTQQDDWDVDFEFPQGKVYDGQRLTLHRNVRKNPQAVTSPQKIKATSVAFTNPKTVQLPRSRLGHIHERQERPRSHLEPVSETGAPIQRYQRPTSRLGHGPSSSVSNIPGPSTPTPSTPSRRDLRAAGSRSDLRYQAATTTSSQLLQSKRSMPVMAGLASPFTSRYARPSSRQDTNRLRQQSPERSESRLSTERKGSTPFLPAGISTSQSQHISLKSVGKNPRRIDSDGSVENMSAAQRSLSRIAARPSTPGKSKTEYSAYDLAALAKKTMSKPMRRRHFGDGSELEAIDDLPTSAAAEAKYIKQPVAKGTFRGSRSKLGPHGPAATSSTSLVSVGRGGAETPVQQPSTPLSPPRNFVPQHHPHSKIPSYLRDTAASRNARAERSISSTLHNLRGEPLMPPSPAKASIPKPTYGSVRRKKSAQAKPTLIRPIGNESENPKEEKGMYYDPEQRLWLGNNDALAPFDVPDFIPQEPSSHDGRHPNVKGFSSPAPTPGKSKMALIMNIGGSSGVQLVNGMVFDPRQMKWLKVAHGERGESIRSGTGSVQLEEEEDVFAGLEDLKEESELQSSAPDRERSVSGGQEKGSDPFTIEDDDPNHASGHSGDEWGVAEEYDVGPEFVRRQRSEEDRWKRKVERWLRHDDELLAEEFEGPGGWRWAIRELVVDQSSVEQSLLLPVG